MGNLKIHDKIDIVAGGQAEVLGEFGSGGQGTVYKANYNGQIYALKWYHPGVFHGKEHEFYQNIENNISKGAPTSAFLWPKAITKVCNGQFGYLMDIRPDGYEELTNYFVGGRKQKQVRFKSFSAICNAAIQIINAFRELHNNGYSYQDINNGNFFIKPDSGDVLICDNDNVSPFGTNLGIMGKQRWMAPEIVTGQNDPDKNSDRFSLAVVLFRLLFINHPLEGRYSTPPCMTKELERKYYGTDPVFVYDSSNPINRPIPGTDHNLKLFWNVYPDYVKAAFTYAFSHDVMMKSKPRLLEKQWMDIFVRLRSEIGLCPHCRQEMFFTYNGSHEIVCMECGKKVPVSNTITIKNLVFPIYCGLKISLWSVDSSQEDTTTQLAEVVRNPKNPQMLGFRNLSARTWIVNLPDGSQRPLPPQQVVPVHTGFVIHFLGGSNDAGEIK